MINTPHIKIALIAQVSVSLLSSVAAARRPDIPSDEIWGAAHEPFMLPSRWANLYSHACERPWSPTASGNCIGNLMADRSEVMRATYDAAGVQGVYDKWGASGVHEFLRNWRCRQRELIGADPTITVGAAFCSSHAEMGVHISASGSFGSEGVFTTTRKDATYFKDGLERVARDDHFRSGDGRYLRIPIANYCPGVTDHLAGEVQVSRSGEKAKADLISVHFLPGTFGGSGESMRFETRAAWRLNSLVDDALADIKRYTDAKDRGGRVIARSEAARRALDLERRPRWPSER